MSGTIAAGIAAGVSVIATGASIGASEGSKASAEKKGMAMQVNGTNNEALANAKVETEKSTAETLKQLQPNEQEAALAEQLGFGEMGGGSTDGSDDGSDQM